MLHHFLMVHPQSCQVQCNVKEKVFYNMRLLIEIKAYNNNGTSQRNDFFFKASK